MKINSNQILAFVLIILSICISGCLPSSALSPPPATPDNRPRVSGCMSWKDLDWLADWGKTLCVYGYQGDYGINVSHGGFWEFHTKSNWRELELGGLDWKDEGKYYSVHIYTPKYPLKSSGETMNHSERQSWESSEYSELY